MNGRGELVFAPPLFGQCLDLHLVLLDADFRAACHEGDFHVIFDRARFVDPAAGVDEALLVERLLERIDRLRGQTLALEGELS